MDIAHVGVSAYQMVFRNDSNRELLPEAGRGANNHPLVGVRAAVATFPAAPAALSLELNEL
jgi:hypothetical protein